MWGGWGSLEIDGVGQIAAEEVIVPSHRILPTTCTYPIAKGAMMMMPMMMVVVIHVCDTSDSCAVVVLLG